MDTKYGKTSLGSSRYAQGFFEFVPDGWSVWIENGEWFTSPTIDPLRFGGHDYDDGGYEQGIRDCKCGAYMLASSSSGPVDPFGACPLNPLTRHQFADRLQVIWMDQVARFTTQGLPPHVATITKGWPFYYVNGATMHEFQFWRLCISFLKLAYWWMPRRHWLTRRWEFPSVIQIRIAEKEDD